MWTVQLQFDSGGSRPARSRSCSVCDLDRAGAAWEVELVGLIENTIYLRAHGYKLRFFLAVALLNLWDSNSNCFKSWD
ncbi:hypothetical protein L2E82_51134 [Cichorium intybus]|nr:hypothetical protein L2E82_51134 [Cichorium intybus]